MERFASRSQEIIHQSNSSVLTQFYTLFQCAMYRSGHLFQDTTTGIIAHLPDLLAQHGIQNVQSKLHTLTYQAGTAAGEDYHQVVIHALRPFRPFLQKWGCLDADYDALYEQVLQETQRSDFQVTWDLLTAWGTNPDDH